LLRDAFEILDAEDIRRQFGADTGYDVLDDVLQRELGEQPLTSQRHRLAVTGRDILRWLAEDYILTEVKTDFDALLGAISEKCDDWLTSASSLGLRKRAMQTDGGRVIDFRARSRMQSA
jgi:hypothetical protein